MCYTQAELTDTPPEESFSMVYNRSSKTELEGASSALVPKAVMVMATVDHRAGVDVLGPLDKVISSRT